MQRKIIGHRVADQLFAAEAAIDCALSAVATLTAMLPNARMEARLSAVVGQGVFDCSSQTIAALTEARRGIVATHNELSGVQHSVGLGAVALGGEDKPDEQEPPIGRLRTVAAGRTAA
ncbi:MAG: hypothetical protein HY859_03915 [Caulobacterales bacterium]|nr:hypothetical protein [Caulobacterales bacterium]